VFSSSTLISRAEIASDLNQIGSIWSPLTNSTLSPLGPVPDVSRKERLSRFLKKIVASSIIAVG